MRKLRILLSFTAVALAPISQASAESLVGLTQTGNGAQSLVTFDSASPSTTISNVSITNLFAGDLLLGIDLRPATNALFGVSNTGRIYSISSAGVATQTATMTTLPSGSTFGFDFNPMANLLRLISETDQNLAVNVDTGATTVQTAITRSGGGAIDIVGSAYTNNFAGTTATTLYGIDSVSGALVVTAGPGGGVYTTVGSGLGVPIGNNDAIGFDISGATGIAYFNRQDTLYTVNLSTGAATRIGNIGVGRVFGLTALSGAVPEASTWAMMIFGFGTAGLSLRRRRASLAATA